MADIDMVKLNEYLEGNSFLGNEACATRLDYSLCQTLQLSIDVESFPHAHRWHRHISELAKRRGPYDVHGKPIPEGPTLQAFRSILSGKAKQCRDDTGCSSSEANKVRPVRKRDVVAKPTADAGSISKVSAPSKDNPKTQEFFDVSHHPALASLQCKSFSMDDSILSCPLGDLVILNAVMVNVQNTDTASVWRERFAKTWTQAQESGLDLKTDLRVSEFEKFVKACGVLPATKKKPQSCLAMLKRCYAKASPFSVSPIVDFYNDMSISHCVSAGGFALDELQADLKLRMSKQGDSFEPFDAGSEKEEIPAGEASYAVGSAVVTRHLAYKQSRTGILKPDSSIVLLQFELQPWMIEAGVHLEIERTLRAYNSSHEEASKVEMRIGYTSKAQPNWTWIR